jgi:cation transport regulator
MPYAKNSDLPERVRGHLPHAAQDIFRKAYNAAWSEYANDARREEIAFRVAWAAVKRSFHKTDARWARYSDRTRSRP